jgi:exodeoxyribonuclease V beta subunit
MQVFDPINSSVNPLPPLTLINASAGTGKTWTVTHVSARWLVEVEGRSPSQILLVTFGREAASELKVRLREQLEAMKSTLRGTAVMPEMDAFKNRATQLGVDTVLSRIGRALETLDDLNARTIHSFAALLHGDGESIDPAATLRLTRAIRETVHHYAETRSVDLRRMLEALTQWSESTAALETLTKALRTTLSTAMSSGGIAAPETLFSFIDSAPLPEITLKKLPTNMKPKARNAKESVADLAEFSLERDRTARQFREDFKKMCLEVEARESLIRELDGVVGYDTLIGDLAIRVRKNPEEVRQAIAGQFELVMIDEFQDTDVAQWEIFRTIFQHGDVETPMMLVGDAKQAIYGFRGGDVTVIQRVAQSVESEADFALADLNVNYRSHEQLIDAVNQFYTPIIDDQRALHTFASPGPDRQPIVYSSVQVSPGKKGALGRFAIRELLTPTEVQEGFTLLHLDLVAQIQRLLGDPTSLKPQERHPDGRQWRFNDIAVLCLFNAEIDDIQRLLEDRGMACVTPKTRTVFTSPAATHFRVLLWTLCDPGDTRRMRSLAATWFSPLLERDFDFGMAAGELRHRGAATLQREVLDEATVETMLGVRGGLRHYTDIDHCFELLAQEFPSGVSPTDAFAWFDDMIADATDANVETSNGQRRIESDENAIRLLTVHASKGLQFPIVLVPTLESGAKDPTVFSQTSATGRQVDPGLAILGKSDRTSVIQGSHREELDRLTYVALTRAEQILIAWKTEEWDDSGKKSPFVEAVYHYQRSGHTSPLVEIEGTDPKALGRSKLDYMGGASSLVAPLVAQSRSIDEYGRRWSYSRLTIRRDSAVPESEFEEGASNEEEERTASVDPTLPGFRVFGDERGAQLGDAVHKTLEHVVGRVASSDHERVTTIAQRWFDNFSVPMPADIAHTIERILLADLGIVFNGHCLDDYHRTGVTIATEMRFILGLASNESRGRDAIEGIKSIMAKRDPEGPFGTYFESLVVQPGLRRMTQGFLNGSIDLVAPVIDGGKYRVVDYKTNSLKIGPTFDEVHLHSEMIAAGYPLQALLYVVALYRHLSWRSGGSLTADHIGGASYLYVRGMAESTAPGYGVANWQIPSIAIEELSNALGGRG